MVEKFRDTHYYKVLKFIRNNFPEYEDSFFDSICDDQYESKKWLCGVLKDLKITEPKQVEKYCVDAGVAGWQYPLLIDIVGSWFGWPFIEMIDKVAAGRITTIDCYDTDETNKKIMAQYNNFFEPEYNVSQHDDYFDRKEKRRRHFIFCTSCEHMDDLDTKQYYKGNPFLCLQSNNYFGLNEHINCVNNADELIKKNKIKKVWFKGVKQMTGYTGFMVIGQWE